jgi:hypothetical protein
VVGGKITIAHDHAGSKPRNRLVIPKHRNTILVVDDVAELIYDGAISRWRVVSTTK